MCLHARVIGVYFGFASDHQINQRGTVQVYRVDPVAMSTWSGVYKCCSVYLLELVLMPDTTVCCTTNMYSLYCRQAQCSRFNVFLLVISQVCYFSIWLCRCEQGLSMD